MIKKHDSFALPSGDLRGTQFRVYYNDCVGNLRAQDARTIEMRSTGTRRQTDYNIFRAANWSGATYCVLTD